MSKSTITKTWIGGLAVFAVGIMVAIVGVFLMLAYGGTFSRIADTNNYNYTPDMNGFFWTTVALIVIGGLIAVIGSIVQLVGWIAGLFNSYLLPEKTWFLVLLIGGLLSFVFAPTGFAAMIAYLVAAPDGTPYRQLPRATQQAKPLTPTA